MANDPKEQKSITSHAKNSVNEYAYLFAFYWEPTDVCFLLPNKSCKPMALTISKKNILVFLDDICLEHSV